MKSVAIIREAITVAYLEFQEFQENHLLQSADSRQRADGESSSGTISRKLKLHVPIVQNLTFSHCSLATVASMTFRCEQECHSLQITLVIDI